MLTETAKIVVAAATILALLLGVVVGVEHFTQDDTDQGGMAQDDLADGIKRTMATIADTDTPLVIQRAVEYALKTSADIQVNGRVREVYYSYYDQELLEVSYKKNGTLWSLMVYEFRGRSTTRWDVYYDQDGSISLMSNLGFAPDGTKRFRNVYGRDGWLMARSSFDADGVEWRYAQNYLTSPRASTKGVLYTSSSARE